MRITNVLLETKSRLPYNRYDSMFFLNTIWISKSNSLIPSMTTVIRFLVPFLLIKYLYGCCIWIGYSMVRKCLVYFLSHGQDSGCKQEGKYLTRALFLSRKYNIKCIELYYAHWTLETPGLHYRLYHVKSLNECSILRHNSRYRNQCFKIKENSIICVFILVFKYTCLY